MPQIILFLISILIGSVYFVLYFFQRLIAKKTALFAVTIILDLVWCILVLFGGLLFMHTLCAGFFYVFTVFGFLSGFFALMLISELLTLKIKSAFNKRRQIKNKKSFNKTDKVGKGFFKKKAEIISFEKLNK